jgi:hypothetical protein
MHFYRPRLLELEELALPNVLADPLGVAGLDTLLAAGEVRHLAHLVGDAILPLHLSDAEIHAPPGHAPRWTVPSVPQQGPHSQVASPFASLPPGGGSGSGGDGGPPPAPKVYQIQHGAAASWPAGNYPAIEIGPPPGSTAPPFWGDQYWNPTTNAFEWNNYSQGGAAFAGTISSAEVYPPAGYVVGPHVDTWSEWTGQDVAGQWSGGYLWMQAWNPGIYGIEIDFAGGSSSYFCYLTVSGGGAAGQPGGIPQPYQLPTATNNFAIVISAPTQEAAPFTKTAAQLLPNCPRATTFSDAVGAINQAWLANGRNPVNAILIGHGGISAFQFGDNDWISTGVAGEQSEEKSFATALQGRVSSLTIFSCYTGLTGGSGSLAKQLAQDLHAPGGCSVTVSAYTSGVDCCTQAYAGARPSYWAVDSGGNWVTYTSP